VNRERIIGEIKRTAEANGNVPLGERMFFAETRITRTILWRAGFPNYGSAVEAAVKPLALYDSSHQRHQPAAAGDFEFAEDRMKMLFYHWHTQPGVFRDLLVASSVADKPGNFLLAARKLG
jgi:hypothetical protein